jgi:hypothetical protein
MASVETNRSIKCSAGLGVVNDSHERECRIQ